MVPDPDFLPIWAKKKGFEGSYSELCDNKVRFITISNLNVDSHSVCLCNIFWPFFLLLLLGCEEGNSGGHLEFGQRNGTQVFWTGDWSCLTSSTASASHRLHLNWMSTEVNLENNFSFSTQGKYCQEINGAQSLWFYFERSKHVTVTVLISHLFYMKKHKWVSFWFQCKIYTSETQNFAIYASLKIICSNT